MRSLSSHLQNAISTLVLIKSNSILPEWVATAAEIGNKKARAFWESRLPPGKHPSIKDNSNGRESDRFPTSLDPILAAEICSETLDSL